MADWGIDIRTCIIFRSSNETCLYEWKGFLGDLVISSQSTLGGINIVAVSLGKAHCLYQSQDGDVFVCGDNSKGQLGLNTLDVKVQNEPVKVLELGGNNAGKPVNFAYIKHIS